RVAAHQGRESLLVAPVGEAAQEFAVAGVGVGAPASEATDVLDQEGQYRGRHERVSGRNAVLLPYHAGRPVGLVSFFVSVWRTACGLDRVSRRQRNPGNEASSSRTM